MKPALGVDLGGTNLRAAVVDADSGQVLVRRQCPTLGHEGHPAVIERMLALIQEVVEAGGLSPRDLAGLGVGVPGTADMAGGIIHFLTNLPGQWRNVPLQAILEERTGIPAALINDVRALTLAEWRYGAGRQVTTLACFAIGTGIGGGLVVNGQLHLGLGGTAGEFGHQVVEVNGPPCGCGGRGCLELYASGPAIAAQGAKAVLHGHTSRIGALAGYDLNRVTAAVVAQAAQEGDPLAQDILRRAGTYLGIAVGNVICAVSPAMVIFGGGVAQAGQALLGPVRQTVAERVHVVPAEQVQFVLAELGDDAGLVGAALWASRTAAGGADRR